MAKLTFAGLLIIMISLGLTLLMFSLILASHIWTLYDWFRSHSPETGLLVAAALMLFILVFIFSWIAALVGNILIMVDSKRMNNRLFSILGLVFWAVLPLVAIGVMIAGAVATGYIGYMRIIVPLCGYFIMIWGIIALFLPLARYVPKWTMFVPGALFLLGLGAGVILMFPSWSGKTMAALIPMEAAFMASAGFVIVLYIITIRKVNLVRQTVYGPGMEFQQGPGMDIPLMLPPQ